MESNKSKCTWTSLLVAGAIISCSPENSALDNFKSSQAGQEISRCAGVAGSIEWSIFDGKNNLNPDVRVIQAIVTKPDKNWNETSRSSNECSSQRDYEFGKKHGLNMAPPCQPQNEKLKIQFLYNVKSKISEISHAGNEEGEKTNRFLIGLKLASFCANF